MNFEELFIRIFILLTVRLPGMSSRSNLHRYQGYIAPIHPSTSPPSTPPPSAPSPPISSSPPRTWTPSTGSPSKLVFRSHYPGFNFDHEESGKSTEAGGRSTFDLSNPNGGRSTYDLSFPDGGRSTSEFSLQDGGRSTSDLSVQALRGARSRVSRDGFEKGVRMLEKPESRKPRFDPRVENNLTVVLGQTAQLQCRVFNLGNKTVSWLRQDTMHILSFSIYTFTTNSRFKPRYDAADNLWLMNIRDTRAEDAGIYECQVSTIPVISRITQLNIVEMPKGIGDRGYVNDGAHLLTVPAAHILGDKELSIETGRNINVTCVVHQLTEGTIRWIHHGEDDITQELNYNTPGKDVSVLTRKGNPTISTFILYDVIKSDSGEYSCTAGTSKPATVNVHVIEEDVTSLLYGGDIANLMVPLISLFIAASILLLLASIRAFFELRKRAMELPK